MWGKGLRALVRLPAWAMIVAVRAYQLFLSPLLGRHCRFEPSCSNYFIQAVKKYGALRGACKGAWRICRCNPFNPGGYDPP
jgi:putative membrane protein insertion efficiency factor